VEELLRPRDSFKGHSLDTAWNRLQLAYFAEASHRSAYKRRLQLDHRCRSRNKHKARFVSTLASYCSEQLKKIGNVGNQ
jgi:hypothetical protein